MKRRLLLGYQLLTGLSDTGTGLTLIFAPARTLDLMGLHIPQDSLLFLSYIGTFVLSVGVACLYGGVLLMSDPVPLQKLETVWLLTAITRGLVALFVGVQIIPGLLERGWVTVAITDAALALFQFLGLIKGWLGDATR